MRHAYCSYCEKKHRAIMHGAEGEKYAYCQKAYMKCHRAQEHAWEPIHPTWLLWTKKFGFLCPSMSLIHTLAARPDIQAICTASALCGEAENKWSSLANTLYFVLFAIPLYWAAPAQQLWHAMKDIDPDEATSAIWRNAGMEIENVYAPKASGAAMKIKSGVLRYGRAYQKGWSPLRNPAERTGTMERFRALADSAREMQHMAKELALAMPQGKNVELASLLSVLEESGAGLYSGTVSYKNLRLCRCLCAAAEAKHADNVDDWGKWKSMSPNVRKTIERQGLESYAKAVLFRDAMREKTRNPNYSFADMTLFICMQEGLEADDDC